MRILGFVGPKQAGKDTSADFLKEMKKANGKIAFANPLKKMCSDIFDIHMNYFVQQELKEKPLKDPVILTKKALRDIRNKCVEIVDPMDGAYTVVYNPHKASIAGLENKTIMTPRELLQIVGTDYIRNRIFQNWHVQAAVSPSILSSLVKSGTYCVTDIRFVNEYEFLKEKFGKDFECYYILRPKAEKELAKAAHASEKEVLTIKELIGEENILDNSGSLDDLRTLLKDKIKKYTPKTSEKDTQVEQKDGNTVRSGRFVYKKR